MIPYTSKGGNHGTLTRLLLNENENLLNSCLAMRTISKTKSLCLPIVVSSGGGLTSLRAGVVQWRLRLALSDRHVISTF